MPLRVDDLTLEHIGYCNQILRLAAQDKVRAIQILQDHLGLGVSEEKTVTIASNIKLARRVVDAVKASTGLKVKAVTKTKMLGAGTGAGAAGAGA